MAKSMRWGNAGSAGCVPCIPSWRPSGRRREPEIVPFSLDGIQAGDETRGHRFLAPAAFRVKRFDDYVAKLARAKVVLDPQRRADMILHDAKNLAFAQGYELVEDAGLLAEVAAWSSGQSCSWALSMRHSWRSRPR